MPRRDNDYEDEDDRPRRRRPPDEDEDEDRPARARRRRDEDNEDERPARPRRRRVEDDEDDRPRKRKKKTSTGLVLGIIGGVVLLCCGGGGVVAYILYGRVSSIVREDQTSTNNLKQVGLGFHNYHDRNGAFPNNSYAPDGKPLLSWRVHLLPYVEEQALYSKFNLNEPWDSPTNRPLINQMPRVYGSPKANALAGPGKTFYRGFSHPGAMFEKPRGPGQVLRLNFAQIPDGSVNTILVVDAGEAVEWTKPDDLDWSPGRPRPALGGSSPGLSFCLVLLADGSVRRMRKDVPDQTLRWLIDRRDGNVIPPGWEQ
jgi:Protein of unknown function (DUF1559)